MRGARVGRALKNRRTPGSAEGGRGSRPGGCGLATLDLRCGKRVLWDPPGTSLSSSPGRVPGWRVPSLPCRLLGGSKYAKLPVLRPRDPTNLPVNWSWGGGAHQEGG